MRMSRFYILGILISFLLLPINIVVGDIPTPSFEKDDSDTIVLRLKESMEAYGLISVEQHTGRLLFNPSTEKLRSMSLKKKFLIPAMIVNQVKGLHIVTELPFNCFIISGQELATDQYKGFKQYETARYLRDVKATPISRVLLCQAVGSMGVKSWGRSLDLNIDDDKFVFDEHVGLTGDKFYYFLNSDGIFEMYM